MLQRIRVFLVCVLAIVLAVFLVTGCSASDSEDATSTSQDTEAVEESEAPSDDAEEATEDVSTDAEESEPEIADATDSDLVGSWANPEGGVFRELTLNADGTADTLNYANVESPGTWSIDDDAYFEVESDAGETYGGPITWASETEFSWAYESSPWTRVE